MWPQDQILKISLILYLHKSRLHEPFLPGVAGSVLVALELADDALGVPDDRLGVELFAVAETCRDLCFGGFLISKRSLQTTPSVRPSMLLSVRPSILGHYKLTESQSLLGAL